MSEMAASVKDIERQLEAERADIGKGLPMFARGRLNCNGAEEVTALSYPYADMAESGMVTRRFPTGVEVERARPDRMLLPSRSAR
jgi:hypothetical protein